LILGSIKQVFFMWKKENLNEVEKKKILNGLKTKRFT